MGDCSDAAIKPITVALPTGAYALWKARAAAALKLTFKAAA
jgi:hypothetical protein